MEHPNNIKEDGTIDLTDLASDAAMALYREHHRRGTESKRADILRLAEWLRLVEQLYWSRWQKHDPHWPDSLPLPHQIIGAAPDQDRDAILQIAKTRYKMERLVDQGGAKDGNDTRLADDLNAFCCQLWRVAYEHKLKTTKLLS